MTVKKYDCEKILDFKHEKQRMCVEHNFCKDCPMGAVRASCDNISKITEDSIRILQKWSDENPEPPKLTPEERAFVAAFKVKESKRIERRHGKVYVVSMYGYQEFEIWPSLFKFIEEGEHVPLTELMQLEVEDE